MKTHKAINRTSVPLLTMHMFLYPHGDRSYESTLSYQYDICIDSFMCFHMTYRHVDIRAYV